MRADDTGPAGHSTWPTDSVGQVRWEDFEFVDPLALECGQTLPRYTLRVERYGELNADRSNAVLICHALSGDHHAAGYYRADERKPGWWDACIGPGKPIDTNRFHVVSLNNLGGCAGSSGPLTANPATGQPWGPDFPIVTVRDWVQSQNRLRQALGIPHWAAVIGGSLGGMQALQWGIDFPDLVRHVVAIAAAPRLSTQNIAFNEVARQAILTDPDFCDGHYRREGRNPARGLMLARMLGHITYLSDAAMANKFGRELISGKPGFSFAPEFQVESYLRYQGSQFIDRFDANSYLRMTKALDYFDPAREFGGDLDATLRQMQARTLFIAFTRDWRFSPERSEELVRAALRAGRDVSYACIDSPLGHDDFLVPVPDYLAVFGGYMARVAETCL
ncbi:MAG: homoserine O-acetyltransferase [Oceanococcaceae bacterium]